jgi:hypothetical protein
LSVNLVNGLFANGGDDAVFGKATEIGDYQAAMASFAADKRTFSPR